ncbi:uncharacterized protein LOC142321753 isoform X2 [Lycorma delicatula]|uniref:uncharacterized protein LOC142321753 isoform X2 n=1 Tax=Lycorma delicatula TaxID=130591 RepID=UPI003F5191E8
MDENSNELGAEISQVKEVHGKEKIKEKLRYLEIPFNWNLNQVGPHQFNVIPRLEEKDEEIVDNQEFKFRNFILQLLLAYEYNRKENADFSRNSKTQLFALQMLNDCERLLQTLKQKGCKECLFLATYDVLLNIVLGSETYIMVELDMISDAKKNYDKIVTLSDQTAQQKAALLAIKAVSLMEYGSDKLVLASEYISHAQQLDPSVAEWHFIFGQVLARIRRVKLQQELPLEEEITAMEKAVEMSDNERYKLHLAQSYREKAFRMFCTIRHAVKNNKETYNKINEINTASCNIYRELLSKNSDNVRILARCAFGITKLPVPFRDVPLAVTSIEKAHELSPNNPMVNHFLGIIYERFANKPDDASKYYSIATDLGVFGAAMDLIRLNFSKNPKEYNPVPDLEKAAKTFLEKDRYYQALSQIASYYLFHRNNIPEAWKNVKKISASDPNHSSLRTHKSITLRMNFPCDMCEVMLDDIKLKIAQKKYETELEKESLINIGIQLRKLCPDSHKTYYSFLRYKILDESRALTEGLKKNKNKSRRKKTVNKGWKNKNKISEANKSARNPNLQFCNRNRSKSNKVEGKTQNTSKERRFWRASSNNDLNRDEERTQNTSQERRSWRGSTNYNLNRDGKKRTQSNNAKKSQSTSCSHTVADFSLTLSENAASKWQRGCKGSPYSSLESLWYGPNYKPRSKSLSDVIKNPNKSQLSRYSEKVVVAHTIKKLNILKDFMTEISEARV